MTKKIVIFESFENFKIYLSNKFNDLKNNLNFISH